MSNFAKMFLKEISLSAKCQTATLSHHYKFIILRGGHTHTLSDMKSLTA